MKNQIGMRHRVHDVVSLPEVNVEGEEDDDGDRRPEPLVLVERDRLFGGQRRRAIDQPFQLRHGPRLGEQADNHVDARSRAMTDHSARYIFSAMSLASGEIAT